MFAGEVMVIEGAPGVWLTLTVTLTGLLSGSCPLTVIACVPASGTP